MTRNLVLTGGRRGRLEFKV